MKKWVQGINKPFFWVSAAILWFLISAVVVYLVSWRMDTVTGIAAVTLFFMMLQTEHERCDRLRSGWTEVRRLTFAATSAIQRGKQKQQHPDAAEYLEKAQTLLQDLYSAILLHGKGS